MTESTSAGKLRIIGDVHGQVDEVMRGHSRTYLEIIADVAYSVQVGDMGAEETYDLLKAHVDPSRHRFFGGNHDNYLLLPEHSLGDFGSVTLGGVDFFFIRGAETIDKAKLIQLGKQHGTQIWFYQEELTADQMKGVTSAYLLAKPEIVITHEAPDEIARFAYENAARFRHKMVGECYRSSRTALFLAHLLEMHQPRLWVFGHHHRDWTYREEKTQFVCVGELSYVDIDAAGRVV